MTPEKTLENWAASGGIWTHDTLFSRRVLYRWTTEAAQMAYGPNLQIRNTVQCKARCLNNLSNVHVNVYMVLSSTCV